MSEWKCEPCDKEFKGEVALDMHNKDKHGIKMPRRHDRDNEDYTEADYQTWLRL